MSELTDVVEELIATQQTLLRAVTKATADLWLIEMGESTHQRTDVLKRLAQTLAPLVLDADQLREAQHPDEGERFESGTATG